MEMENLRPKLTANDFREALSLAFANATATGQPFVEVNSGLLHRQIGLYPGPRHQMPNCCSVMRQAMMDGDVVVDKPKKGNGASLTIRYRVPRKSKAQF
jgi:hypothetical protein